MKIYVFYRQHTESDIKADCYLKNFRPMEREFFQKIDVDTKDGCLLAQTYSVMSYPSVLVVDNIGRLIAFWHGEFPRLMEIPLYFQRYSNR